MCGNMSDLAPILVKARELQIMRIKGVFETGFRLPTEICERYLRHYQAIKASGNNNNLDVYKLLFEHFWAEVGAVINVHEELNHLDKITLFGEVCSGECPYTAN